MSAQGKGEARVLVAGDQAGEPRHRLMAGGGDRDGELGELALGGVEPAGLARFPLPTAGCDCAEPVRARSPAPRARRRRPAPDDRENAVGRRPARRTDRPWQASARRSADARKRPARRPPAPGRAGICAAATTRRRAGRCRSRAGPCRSGVSISIETAQPPAPPTRAHRAEIGAAQAAARREHRQSFEHIGLARAVLTGEHDAIAADVEIERGVGAEIRQNEPPHRGLARGGRRAR